MRFRTEIEPTKGSFEIATESSIFLIGSCFSDEISLRLRRDGFSATGNSLGPLFNPLSILNALNRGLTDCGRYGVADLIKHGIKWHCLDWANRYQAEDALTLLNSVNTDFETWSMALKNADTLIITFGNTKVYEYTNGIAGNCHKLPTDFFTSRRLNINEIVDAWSGLDLGTRHVIMTLSPVRYTENGLALSNLAKATLRVAIDEICKNNGWDYFPSYEILNDDLRDYRFYAADMKHPSETAVDYIYEHFTSAYMTAATREKMLKNRRASLTAAHQQNT